MSDKPCHKISLQLLVILVGLGLFGVGLAGLPVRAWANDSGFGGVGANLVPLKETRVKMVSEDIVLQRTALLPKADRKSPPGWSVVATYRFVNLSAKAVTMQVGFPEVACALDMDCEGDANGFTFQDLTTTIDGVPVAMRIGKVSRNAHAWVPELGRVHLFDATFPPGKEVEIQHRYRMGTSGNVMVGMVVEYVTITGALWNGPIDRARFTVRTDFRPWEVTFPRDEYKLSSFSERMVNGRPQSELVFEASHWVPKQNLFLELSGRDWLWSNEVSLVRGCPWPGEVAGSTVAEHRAVVVDDDFFAGLSRAQLRHCRNVIFAAHGYPFKSVKNQRRYYGGPKPARSRYWEEIRVMRLLFHPNPHYEPALLRREEGLYIQQLRAYEAKLRMQSRPARK